MTLQCFQWKRFLENKTEQLSLGRLLYWTRLSQETKDALAMPLGFIATRTIARLGLEISNAFDSTKTESHELSSSYPFHMIVLLFENRPT